MSAAAAEQADVIAAAADQTDGAAACDIIFVKTTVDQLTGIDPSVVQPAMYQELPIPRRDFDIARDALLRGGGECLSGVPLEEVQIHEPALSAPP